MLECDPKLHKNILQKEKQSDKKHSELYLLHRERMRLPGKPEKEMWNNTVFSDFLQWSLRQPAALLCTNAKLCTCLCTSNTLSLLHHSIWSISIQASIILLPAVPAITEAAVVKKLQELWHCSPKSLFLRILPSWFVHCRYQASRQMSLLQNTGFGYSEVRKFSQASRAMHSKLEEVIGMQFPNLSSTQWQPPENCSAIAQ